MSFGSKSLPKPDSEQLRRWELIRAWGCVICGQPAEIHHLKSGNVRIGHDYTIGLCSFHHRGIPTPYDPCNEGPTLMDGSRAFHEKWGDDEFLLETQNICIRWKAVPVRQRRRNSTKSPAKCRIGST